MNMRDVTLGGLLSFMTGYTLCEPYLFQEWCPDRLDSSFCVPMFLNTHALMSYMRGAIQLRVEETPNLRPYLGLSKYSAMNTRCLQGYGTIEMRQLPGTTDMEHVHEWIDVLTRLYDATVNVYEPNRIIDMYKMDREWFHRTAVGDFIETDPKQRALAETAAQLIAGPEM